MYYSIKKKIQSKTKKTWYQPVTAHRININLYCMAQCLKKKKINKKKWFAVSLY